VLYVPGLEKNLISISTIEDSGYGIFLLYGKVLVHPRGSTSRISKMIGIK
jgi:hypothetical protein